MTAANQSRRRQQLNEQSLQRSVIQHLRWRAPRDVWFAHYPGGGWRSRTEAAIFKGLGVKAGTPDLIVIRGGRTFALELKAPGGRLSPTQIACHGDMRRAGATVAVATGIDQALALLSEWNILPEGAE
jgi:hypothetical protein